VGLHRTTKRDFTKVNLDKPKHISIVSFPF